MTHWQNARFFHGWLTNFEIFWRDWFTSFAIFIDKFHNYFQWLTNEICNIWLVSIKEIHNFLQQVTDEILDFFSTTDWQHSQYFFWDTLIKFLIFKKWSKSTILFRNRLTKFLMSNYFSWFFAMSDCQNSQFYQRLIEEISNFLL